MPNTSEIAERLAHLCVNVIKCIEPAVIWGVITYSYAVNYAYNAYKNVYDNNILFSTIMDDIAYDARRINSYVYNYKIEPKRSMWISFHFAIPHPRLVVSRDKYTLFELYYDYDYLNDSVVMHRSMNEQIVKMRYHDYYNELAQNRVTSNAYGLILKIDNKYISRVCNASTTESSDLRMDCKSTNIRFISISYSHPRMANPIFITLNPGMYIVGNQILSDSFILRELNYQSEAFIFDMNYEVNIIDGNIYMFQLKSGEYIEFTSETKYVVKSLNHFQDEVENMEIIDFTFQDLNPEKDSDDLELDNDKVESIVECVFEESTILEESGESEVSGESEESEVSGESEESGESGESGESEESIVFEELETIENLETSEKFETIEKPGTI